MIRTREGSESFREALCLKNPLNSSHALIADLSSPIRTS